MPYENHGPGTPVHMYNTALRRLNELGDYVIATDSVRIKGAKRLAEKYHVNDISTIVALHLANDDYETAALSVNEWLGDPRNWPLFIVVLNAVVYQVMELKDLSSGYPDIMHNFHEALDTLEAAQLVKSWYYQRVDAFRNKYYGAATVHREFEGEDAVVTVELRDTVEEGDFTRHGRWHVTLTVVSWNFTEHFACERARLSPVHDQPSLRFTYLQGPRAGQEYRWTPGGEEGEWDQELFGAIAWMPARVCRFIFGMDEVAQDVDLGGTRE